MVHGLRPTFATPALEDGANVVEVQQLLGHASLDTTRRYLDAPAEGLRQVVRVMLARWPSGSISGSGLSSRSGSGPGGVRSTVE